MAAVIVLVHGHPYPDRSRAGRALLEAVRDLPGLDVRVLADRYPDFAIDVEAEQQALASATALVWVHPIFWYGPPAILKLWIDRVLAHGWAYGPGGRALVGKRCLWVATTGGDPDAYADGGVHGHPFAAFAPPMRQTARFCGMHWERPLLIHGARSLDDAALAALARDFRTRLERLAGAGTAPPGEAGEQGWP